MVIGLIGATLSSFFMGANDRNGSVGISDRAMEEKKETYVQKKVLSNGMTVLVRPVHVVPRVSMQIWYNVGSKDEKTGERGIAHLIEHMIFKGTKTLSESDINVLAHKLSGSINAFTSYDYTGYLFNMPVQHWQEVLPVMADSMQNVSFKDDHLNSEMKAVIQELKMNRDNYFRVLIFDLLTELFPDHPYHYPVIGYKQDLWNVKGDDLRAFYKKHYWPNNATLVVVGDVNSQEVFTLAEKTFGKIPANAQYHKEKFYHTADIASRSVTIYRDIQQPMVSVTWVIPGAQEKMDHLFDVINNILGSSKASRLYRKLVDELKLCSSLSSLAFTLFEHGTFMVVYEPHSLDDVPKINELIQAEINDIIEKGLTPIELTRSIKQAQMNYYRLLESIESQAGEIGRAYLATGDPEYAFEYLTKATAQVEQKIRDILKEYFRPTTRNYGMALPLPERDKELWKRLQEESDQEDKEILSARIRTSPVEPPSYAEKIKAKDVVKFNFPKAKSFELSNGLKVLYYHTANTPKINFALRLKAESYYEPEDKAGIYSFLTGVMTEGTEKYTAAELADELENRGIVFSIAPGAVSMALLSADLEQGMSLLEEILSRPRFDAVEIEKVRQQMLVGLKNFWDEPGTFVHQLIAENIYQGHPFSKRTMGTDKSLAALTKADLIQWHKRVISPNKATLAIVGDLEGYDLKNILEKTLGRWKGPVIEPIVFPALKPVKPTEYVYPINRDQVVLAFVGLSVDRKSPEFDKLTLFDQIFGGGALGSLHSRLFSLREQSGIFYGISGSLVSGASEEKGMVSVRTKVSLDRLEEAEKVIKNAIDTAANTVTDQEFTEARQAIVNSLISSFASNQAIAQVFIFLDRFGFPADYYDVRNEQLAKISKKEMIDAVKKVLSSKHMMEFKVGRLEPQNPAKCETKKLNQDN